MRKFVIEFGHGVDLHGQDVNNAAAKAVKDAISHSCLSGLAEICGIKDLDEVLVDDCESFIGFSSVPGCIEVIEESDEFGGWVKLGSPGEIVVAPIAPGVVRPVPVKSMFMLELHRPYRHCAKQSSMIALER